MRFSERSHGQACAWRVSTYGGHFNCEMLWFHSRCNNIFILQLYVMKRDYHVLIKITYRANYFLTNFYFFLKSNQRSVLDKKNAVISWIFSEDDMRWCISWKIDTKNEIKWRAKYPLAVLQAQQLIESSRFLPNAIPTRQHSLLPQMNIFHEFSPLINHLKIASGYSKKKENPAPKILYSPITDNENGLMFGAILSVCSEMICVYFFFFKL